MIRRIPRVVLYFIMGVVLAVQAGCQNKGSYKLHLEFPDEEAKTSVSRVHVWVLKPSGLVCEELISGVVNPKSLTILADTGFRVPPDVSGPSLLTEVPVGDVLFYAEGLNANEGILLKGCSPARVESGKTIDVTVRMEWSCRPVSEEEIPQNGVDDNCDGRTDECAEDRDCNDANGCTMDLCVGEECHHQVFPGSDGQLCADGKLCTLSDKCAGGICVGTPKDCSSFDGICQEGVCDPATGTCGQRTSADGTLCDDGMYCTVNDACANGECAGTPRECTSADPCLVGACNEGAKECEFAQKSIPGAEGSAGTCDDGKDNDCDGLTDMSDPNCRPCQNASECNDGNVCTTDECTVEGCRNNAVQDASECDDGKYCTAGDQCAGGVCTPAGPRSCSEEEDACHFGVCDEEADQCVKQQKTNGTSCEDGFSCTAVEQCADGACQVVAARDCTDGNDCTIDTCQEVLGCQHQNQPRGTPEGNPGDASCDNGIDDDCDLLTDYEEDPDCRSCLPEDPCDDNNPCTDDSCTQGLCLHQNRGDGTSCEDGFYCIASKTCTGGMCGGVPRVCADDGIACTDDLCDSQANQCVHPWHAQPGVKEICFDGIDQDCDHLTDGCCRGNGTFSLKVDYPYASGARSMITGDFNSDGILDLAVANYSSNSVSILLGNGSGGQGNGVFVPKVDYPTGTGPRSLVAGDFNTDGILDLAVANIDGNNVSVLLGNGSGGKGNGTFATSVNYSAGINPYSVTTRDFNADSVLDLAAANSGSDSVSVFLGNGSSGRGNGTFATKVDYPTARDPRSMTTGDYNADSILDLVVANISASSVSVLLGNGSGGRGDGTFATKVDYPTGTWPNSVTTGDFNGNGILDLAVVNNDSSNVSVLLGNGSGGRGDGTFAPKVDYPTGTRPWTVTAGDFNTDSILDLAVTNYSSANVSVLLGNGSGDGTFLPKEDYLTGTGPIPVVTGDFNADGISDLAVANDASATVSILMGNGSGSRGNGTFAAKMDYAGVNEPWAATVGDFNADGILDLAVANSGTNNTVGILLGKGSSGRGDGTFAPNVNYPTGAWPTSVAAGDFNADSVLDLVVANSSSANLSVFLGNGSSGRGNGTFAPNVNYPAGVGPRSVVIGDFNTDSISDLAVTDSDSNVVNVLLGNGSSGRGNGTFASKVNYSTGTSPRFVMTADFNADGILDLAVANFYSNSISILLGNGDGGRGDGTFAAKADYPTGESPRSATVGDFNSDGVLDLGVANDGSNTVCVILGNGSSGRGDGTFAPKVNYPAGARPSFVAVGDFNKDSILDLVVANRNSSTVSVLLGNGNSGRGNGTFAPKVDFVVGSEPFWVVTGDFTADGILDLATVNYDGNSVSVLLGRGTCLSQ
jgi:hypothetical protein